MMDIKRFPLAIVAPSLGKPSETFIHRHMTTLLPERTVVAVRRIEPGFDLETVNFPWFEFGHSRRTLGWAFDSARYLFRLSSLSPVQQTVADFLDRHGAEAILSQYLDQSLKWLPVSRQCGARFYAHAHGYDVSRSLRNPALCKDYLRLNEADGIFTMSDYSRKRLIEIGLKAENIHVIPYGIDVPGAPLVRQEGEHIRCVAIGRMVAKKAPLATLEAFRLAWDILPRLRLDMVGDGTLFEDAVCFIRSNGLNDIVTLHGTQPNAFVLALMRECDIFLQHSITDPVTGDQEGLPVAMLEAMAQSLPVISTRHAGIPESVVEGESGLLGEEGDIEAMAQNLVKLAGDADLRSRLGQAGWRRVRDHFSGQAERQALIDAMGLSTG